MNIVQETVLRFKGNGPRMARIQESIDKARRQNSIYMDYRTSNNHTKTPCGPISKYSLNVN